MLMAPFDSVACTRLGCAVMLTNTVDKDEYLVGVVPANITKAGNNTVAEGVTVQILGRSCWWYRVKAAIVFGSILGDRREADQIGGVHLVLYIYVV